ncbi:unnamed protein product [Brassica rapa subsp. trilocularis]
MALVKHVTRRRRPCHLPYYGKKQGEEDYSDCKDRYVAAKTAVFWDMDGCEIPQGGNADLISRNIKLAIENDGFGDTVTIYAYGYMSQIRGLESFGIVPRYFPAVGDRKEKLEMILVDALCCAVDNPDTTNLMVISWETCRDTMSSLSLLSL